MPPWYSSVGHCAMWKCTRRRQSAAVRRWSAVRASEWHLPHIAATSSSAGVSSTAGRRSSIARWPRVSSGARPRVSARCFTSTARSSSVSRTSWSETMRWTVMSQPSGVRRPSSIRLSVLPSPDSWQPAQRARSSSSPPPAWRGSALRTARTSASSATARTRDLQCLVAVIVPAGTVPPPATPPAPLASVRGTACRRRLGLAPRGVVDDEHPLVPFLLEDLGGAERVGLGLAAGSRRRLLPVPAVDDVVLPEPPGLHLLLDELPVLHRGHEVARHRLERLLVVRLVLLSRPDDVCIVGVQRQNPFHVARFEMADERLVHAADDGFRRLLGGRRWNGQQCTQREHFPLSEHRVPPLDRGPGADALAACVGIVQHVAPGAIRLAAYDLHGPAADLRALAVRSDHAARPVVVAERELAAAHDLDDATLDPPLGGDEPGEALADGGVPFEGRAARRVDEDGGGLVKRDDRVEVARPDVLGEHDVAGFGCGGWHAAPVACSLPARQESRSVRHSSSRHRSCVPACEGSHVVLFRAERPAHREAAPDRLLASAQAPSRITNGTYAISIEAQQDSAAPRKLIQM